MHMDDKLGLFVVADGMGGHNGGEIASHIAVQQIAEAVPKGFASGQKVASIVQEAISKANQVIYTTAASDPWWHEMGTTVVMALFRDERVYISHVGDSRAYVLQEGAIKQLTQDHTFVAEWVKEGLITPEVARTHKARHGLTMALGIEDEIDVEVLDQAWNQGDSLLLCSDGLTEVLDDPEILDIVSRITDPQDACDALVQSANEKGGPDNITAILIRT